MGTVKRHRYTKEFKFKVALEAIRGEKSLSQLASEFKIAQPMISNWKKQFLERGASIFEQVSKTDSNEQVVEQELIQTIGHQQIQIDWLKKKLGISPSWKGGA